MPHELIVATIMLSMGVLGGVVTYLTTNTEPFSWIKLSRNVFLALAAAILVPLFLRMISSNLLEDAAKNTDGYFVLAGFCMAAALSAQAFISSVTKKLLNEIQEKTRNVEEKLEVVELNIKPVIERSEEPELDISSNNSTESERLNSALTAFDMKILRAMDQNKYTLRTSHGIAQQLELAPNSREAIRDRLKYLKELGLVSELDRLPALSPKPRWYISALGRALLQSSQGPLEAKSNYSSEPQ